MTITATTRLAVRARAHYACEYCGVSEVDAGGELTIDHYHPKSRGGSDELDNLLYCCTRCNQYKADYVPADNESPQLWNPSLEPSDAHFISLADGSIYPLTATGELTLRQLRLNRPALVAYRQKIMVHTEQVRLVTRYQETIRLLEQTHAEQAALLREQQRLLEQQQQLLRLLLSLR